MGNKKNLFYNLIGIITFGISIYVAILILLQTGDGDIWYDEVFSVAFAQRSWSDIVKYTAMDVHPPLYYFYLKAITGLCSFADFITVCKVASFIPLIGMIVIGLTWVRKRFGIAVAGTFTLLISLMPEIQNYYVEIRMYSFAMLFLTIAGCCLVDIISKENESRLSWIIFCICCIAVAYTQYFACVAAIGLYIILLLVSIVRHRAKHIRNTFIMMVVSVISYLPWLPSFYRQVKNVSGSYWIQPMTLRSIPGCVKYIFLPVSGEGKITYVVAGFMIAVFAAIYIMFLASKNAKDIVLLAYTFIGIIPLVMMVIVGFLASIMGSPIFTYRYMIPALGLLYLGVAIAANCINKKWIMVLLVIACIFEGYYGVKNFVWEENYKADHFEDAVELLQGIPKGSVIVANFDHVATISSYYFPDSDVYVYEGATDSLVGELYHGNGSLVSNEDVYKLIEENDNVYFFGSFVSRDEIVEDWSKIGIVSKYEDECLVERYWFNIYQLGLENE